MTVISRTAIISNNTHKNVEDLLDNLTEIYNWALHERNEYYKNTEKYLTYYSQAKLFTIKRNENNNNWNIYNSKFQQNTLRRLNKAFKKFFTDKLYLKGKGFPRFKGERGIRSFEYFRPNKIKKSGSKWKFSIKNLGVFKWKEELPHPVEKLKLVRIIKTPIRVMIQFIFDADKKIESLNNTPIGLDLGIKNRASFSDGRTVSQRKLDYTKLKNLQRKVSKSKKNSNNRKKKSLSYQKEWQRIIEKSKGILHETTTNIIKNISCNLVVEDLNLVNLTKKGKTQREKSQNRNLLNQNLGLFIQMLSYKAESAGGKVVKVNPAYTSKRCSCCGIIKESLTLKDRIFICEHCNFSLDRDYNAAINILHKGIKAFISGGNSPECRADVYQEASLLTA